jgi:hypothetical protein
MHINTVFMDLALLGVGPANGFSIEDENSVWTEFIPESELARLEGLKSYMYLRVKLLFDPPSSSAVMESMNRQIDKFEWKFNLVVETNSKEEIQNGEE